jgi:hypothetical protein
MTSHERLRFLVRVLVLMFAGAAAFQMYVRYKTGDAMTVWEAGTLIAGGFLSAIGLWLADKR